MLMKNQVDKILLGIVTVIYVSPGNVFPAHISLGMRVSPHTYP